MCAQMYTSINTYIDIGFLEDDSHTGTAVSYCILTTLTPVPLLFTFPALQLTNTDAQKLRILFSVFCLFTDLVSTSFTSKLLDASLGIDSILVPSYNFQTNLANLKSTNIQVEMAQERFLFGFH